MTRHLEKSIHPVLESLFLWSMSFSIVTQFAFLLYYLADLVEQCICCSGLSADMAAKTLLESGNKRRSSQSPTKQLLCDLIIE